MADSNRCISLKQHDCNWFADYIAPPHNYRLFPGQVNACILQEFHYPQRGARLEQGAADNKPSNIIWIKAVHIFLRIDCLQYAFFIEMMRKRELHKDAVDLMVLIQLGYLPEQFCGSNVFMKCVLVGTNAYIFTCLAFCLNIQYRGL